MRTEGPAHEGAANWVPLPEATSSTPTGPSSLRQALLDDPLGDPVLHKDRLRPAVATRLVGPPGPALLAAATELMTAALTPPTEAEEEVVLSGREWLEITCAFDRCTSHTAAATLSAVAALDRARLAENPIRAAARDTRRLAADDLAPALRTSPGAASATVGLARQVENDLPLAAEALAEGAMTLAQLKVLAAAVKHLPPAAVREVEEVAVRKAVTMVRSRLAEAVEEAAIQADPAYAARRTAAGIQERDVQLRRSPVPGCVRLVADLERLDGAAAWQVINAMAKLGKEADPGDDGEQGQLTEEERTLAQLRADALVSVLVGEFSPTAAGVAAAARTGATAGGSRADDDSDHLSDDDECEEEDGGPDEEAAEEPADTRALVRIPTPEQRARLAEVHVVVLEDDIDDLIGGEDPEGPDSDPDGPGDGPDDPDGGRLRGGPDASASREPRPSDLAPAERSPVRSEPDAASLEPWPTGQTATPAASQDRDRCPARPRRRARARALAGFGPFGYVPGIGRLCPVTTRSVLADAPWRRLTADATTGVLLTRSRWLLPPPPPPPPPAARSRPPGPSRERSAERAQDQDRLALRERLTLLREMPDEAPPGPTLTYRPHSVMAAHVRARDATCIGPACHHSARSGGIQLDHTRAWGPSTRTRARGGVTEPGNLGCVCQRSHTAKTHGGWDLAQPSPGSFVWTSPLGRVYHRRATPLLPDLAVDDD